MLWISGVIVSIGIGCAALRDWLERSDQSETSHNPETDAEEQQKTNLAALMQDDLAALSNGMSLNAADQDPNDTLAAASPGSDVPAEAATLCVMPYDPKNDDLVLVWDDSRGACPKVTVSPNARNPRIAEVSLDDRLVARVASDAKIVTHRLSVMPRSRAARLGWAAQ